VFNVSRHSAKWYTEPVEVPLCTLCASGGLRSAPQKKTKNDNKISYICAMEKTIITLIAMALLIGCGKIFGQNPDIYIIGSTTNEQGELIATLWKNEMEQNLSGGTYTKWAITENVDGMLTRSVYILGNDVYAVGTKHVPYKTQNSQGTHAVALLWKNGKEQILVEENLPSVANAVFVTGNDVYVAGGAARKTNTYSHEAVLWKNGELQYLPPGIPPSYRYFYNHAQSVYVLNNDVYVAGRIYDNGQKAAFWKNGIVQELTDGSRMADAVSIFVSDNNVYVAGYEDMTDYKTYNENQSEDGEEELIYHKIAILWKNSVAQNLTDESSDAEARSVYVYGKDVYVVGNERNAQGIYVAKLWINGVAQDLSNGSKNTYADSIFIR
jgi:hypothetical protein